MNRFDNTAFDAGVSAYRQGMSVRNVTLKSYADMDRANVQNVDHQAIEAESKSFVLGFVSGLVEDVRKVASGAGRGGLRA